MRIPLSWLKDFVDISIPVGDLAERLTFAGLEVETIEYIGLPPDQKRGSGSDSLAWDRDKIFVGQVVEVKPHPNADRLTLATVDYGHGAPVQVVTGAPNLHVGDRGQKVVFGIEGARLYDGHKPGRELMTLKKGKIRGIESGSMVLSEKELGISDAHEGIILLPEEAPVGMPFADYWGDVVFDVKINPNMARAQSVLGVAREVAALTSQRVKETWKEQEAERGNPDTDYVRIEIADPTLCRRYSALLIRNVEIMPSPSWMQRRLELAGMRPINNIVDITNYVMLERGQPLHAFDADKLVARASGGRPTIIVRPASSGEKMVTLDGVARELKPTDLLITDTAGPVAIAGVMGGAETEVSDSTKNVLLESANFDYISVRRTTQEQKLPSEAATRFGRGISPAQTIAAARRAAQLMHELAGGEIDAAAADAYPNPLVEPTIVFATDQVNRLLGVELSSEQMTDILLRLDFQVEHRGDGTLTATPPVYRLDVDGVHDITEEVARIYGYERIPSTMLADTLPPEYPNLSLEHEERARTLLVEAGLTEVVAYSLTHPAREALLSPFPAAVYSPEDGGKIASTPTKEPGPSSTAEQDFAEGAFDPRPRSPYVEIENPVSVERSVMRQSLLPGMLDILASNLRFAQRAALFEIGRVYLSRTGGGSSADDLLPFEPRRLAIVMTGPREEPSWQSADLTPMDFYDVKGVIEEWTRGLHLPGVSFAAAAHPSFHPGRAAVMRLGEKGVGVFGELHPVVRENFGIESVVLAGEFDADAIFSAVQSKYIVKPISRYPAIRQDIALIVDEAVPAQAVANLIRQTGGALLAGLELFDVYHGAPLPRGKKSLAFRLTFQALDRGLTDADAAKTREKIVQRVKRELGAELRST